MFSLLPHASVKHSPVFKHKRYSRQDCKMCERTFRTSLFKLKLLISEMREAQSNSSRCLAHSRGSVNICGPADDSEGDSERLLPSAPPFQPVSVSWACVLCPRDAFQILLQNC